MIEAADRNLNEIGFTEHGLRHVGLVSATARDILMQPGFDNRVQELAAIAGFTHDVGNIVSRYGHAARGAVLVHPLLVARANQLIQLGRRISLPTRVMSIVVASRTPHSRISTNTSR